jgi:hypothetical protein
MKPVYEGDFPLPFSGDAILAGLIGPTPEENDHAQGYEIASVAVLQIEQQIREEYPGRSDAYYKGVMDGLRQEI